MRWKVSTPLAFLHQGGRRRSSVMSDGRGWYFIDEQPAPAPHLARPEGRAALTHMSDGTQCEERLSVSLQFHFLLLLAAPARQLLRRERIFFELMTSDRKLKASVHKGLEMKDLRDLKDLTIDSTAFSVHRCRATRQQLT